MIRADNSAATPWTFALAGALAAAGTIHCLLTPEHMAMSAIFGGGFLAAGVAQLGMAALAVVRPSRLLYAAVVASTLVLSSMYAYNVLIGLPFHEDAVAAAVDEEPADEHADEVAHSTEAAHPGEADHPRAGSLPDAHPSGDPAPSDEAGHGSGDDHERSADADHHEGGPIIGGGEPVDGYGAATQFAQLSAAAMAGVLLVRSRRQMV